MAISHPSPNFGERRGGVSPSLVVLHYTAMRNADEALARLSSPEFEVSAHYLIHRDGRVFQLVDEKMRAWHAGAGRWRGLDDINSHSIGIELDNDGVSPFCEPQLVALETLLSEMMTRWNIGPEGVIGHSDLAPSRKSDPGMRFDWARLAYRGLAIAPEHPCNMDAPVDSFYQNAARFGYGVEAGEEAILTAFRLRFRPWARGSLDRNDCGIMENLSMRFGVDPGPKFP